MFACMCKMNFRSKALVMSVVSFAGVVPLLGQLPSLSEKENLGYFIVSGNKSHRFGITSDATCLIKIRDEKGDELGEKLAIKLDFNISETQPDGKTVVRKISEESLSSTHAATDKPRDVIFKGKATGDIEFEVYVTEARGGILLGGRLLNPSALKNPTTFSIDVKIPNTKPTKKKDSNKNDDKEHEDKIKNDKVQITKADGKRLKLQANEDEKDNAIDFTGVGITAVACELEAYKKKKVEITASPNSSFLLEKDAGKGLGDGFTLNWKADIAKDPTGKARLSISIR